MSFINKLDPRAKLVSVMLLTVLVFFINRLLVIFCLMLFFIFIRFLAKVSFRSIKSIRNLTLLVIFIILTQTFFGPGDNYIAFPFWGSSILKLDGFIFGLVIVCRLSAIMILFPVFTETTSPYLVAAGIHGLGFNYRSAFVITTTFNLIPLFKEDASVIIDARKLRGMCSFEDGSFIAKMKAYVSLAVPLVLVAMRKARSSSIAMDSRAFGAYKTRTWIDKPKIKSSDMIALFACVIFCICLLFLNYRIN